MRGGCAWIYGENAPNTSVYRVAQSSSQWGVETVFADISYVAQDPPTAGPVKRTCAMSRC